MSEQACDHHWHRQNPQPLLHGFSFYYCCKCGEQKRVSTGHLPRDSGCGDYVGPGQRSRLIERRGPVEPPRTKTSGESP